MWTRSLQPTTALLISPWNCPGTLGSRTCLTCHRRILTLLNSWFVLNHAVSTALSKYTGSQVGHAGIYQYRAFGDQAEMTHATNHASPIKRLAFCSDDSVCVCLSVRLRDYALACSSQLQHWKHLLTEATTKLECPVWLSRLQELPSRNKNVRSNLQILHRCTWVPTCKQWSRP